MGILDWLGLSVEGSGVAQLYGNNDLAGPSVANSVSVAYFRSLIPLFQSNGIDIHKLFSQVGIDVDTSRYLEASYTTDQVSMVWELAVAGSTAVAHGHAMPRTPRFGTVGTVGYVMLTSPDLLTAVRKYSRYLRIISADATLSLERVTEGFWVVLTVRGGTRPVPRQREEYGLASMLASWRWVCGRDLSPLAVHLTHEEPSDLGAYTHAFGCPIRFNSADNRVLLSRADLESPIPGANASLALIHEHQADEELARLGRQKVSQRVSDLIARQLPNGYLQRAHIAKALCIGERTLQRQLDIEGTSFQILADEVRKLLADRYLRQQDMKLELITSLLGFSNQSTLCRASQRWFGMSPGEYRAKFDQSNCEKHSSLGGSHVPFV